MDTTSRPIDYELIRFALVEYEEDGTVEIHYCPTDARMVIHKTDIPMLIGGLESYLDGG